MYRKQQICLQTTSQQLSVDAERVRAAELEGPSVMGLEASNRRQSTTPGGVAEAIEAAARINEADK